MPSIRNIAVAVPVRDGHLLVLDGLDSVKGEAFHRLLGGGIEFGETAELALRREFIEELGVTLNGVRLLGVVEDIFVHEGHPGHEIAHVFAVDSVELDNIPLDATLYVLDEGSPVGWKLLSELNHPVYPMGALDMLRKIETDQVDRR